MPPPSSELEAAIDRLYQAPLAGFTEARNALAAERKQAGDPDGAARVKALTKPTAVAWAANQVYWRDRQRYDALVEALREVASAQREALAGGGAAALKEATQQRTERLQEVARAGERRLVEGGAAGGPAVLQRLTATLEAVASPRPTGSDLPAPGRLVAELSPAGFDLALGLGSLDLPPASPRARRPEPKEDASDAPRRTADEDRAARQEDEGRAERVRLQQSEFEVARLRRELAAAERALEEAESRAVAARADVEQLEARLQQARTRAGEKTAAARDARRALEAGRSDLAAAEATFETLKRSR